MELISVAAVADNRVIGEGAKVPWTIPEDIQQYRARVAEDPVILGRRTFEWVRSDPPGKAQIVMSRTEREYDTETEYHASGIDEAIRVVKSLRSKRAYILGGRKYL